MKKKSKGKKNYLIEIAIVIIIVLIIQNLYITMYKNKTYVLKDSFDYEYKIDERAMVIRDEYLYSNKVSMRIDNSNRQAVGFGMGSFTDFNADSTISGGDYVARLERFTSEEKPKISVQDVRQNIFEKAYDKNDEILDQYMKSEVYTEDEQEVLKNKWQIKSNILKKQGNHLKVMVPGTLNFYVDNYEDILSYDKVFRMKDDFYIDPNISLVKTQKKGLKIINEMDFYLLFSAKNTDLVQNYAKGNLIRIKFEGNDYRAIVEKSYIKGDTTFFICRLEEGIKNFENIRFADIQIVNDKKQVFEVEKSSVIKDGNQYGVFIKAPTGVVKYRPIDIVEEKQNTYWIDAGTNGIITVGNKEMTTVAQFDQIFENPNSLKEGELVE